MKYFLLTFCFIIQIGGSWAQEKFTIHGSTNLIEKGKVVLAPIALAEFYFEKDKIDTVNVCDHQFVFENTLKYPQQYRLIFLNESKKYMTEPFFIDSGSQTILVDSGNILNEKLDAGYGVLVEGSNANNEYFTRYLPLFDSVNQRILIFYDEVEKCENIKDDQLKKSCVVNTENLLKNIRDIRDNILLNYGTQHPESRIVPWILYNSIRRYGYKDVYAESFMKISGNHPTEMIASLHDLLNHQKIKNLGNLFPLVEFVKSHTSKNVLEKNKFTLIEFWYSGCVPCIAQFDKLKNTYNGHHKNGFEIIAISIDDKKTIPDYNRILELKDYPWLQILDIGGAVATSINIQKYPTSFLLDSSGKIIKIDIIPEILEDFLKKNL